MYKYSGIEFNLCKQKIRWRMTILTSSAETKINVSIQSLTEGAKSDCTGGRVSDAVRYCQSEQNVNTSLAEDRHA
jgi:hypothetical protein